MSSLLTIGKKGPLRHIIGGWLKTNEEKGRKVQVSHNIQRPKARHLSVCSSAPKTGWEAAVASGDVCNAHIRAIGNSREEMTIVSIDLNHTCTVDDKTNRRNYNTTELQCVSDVMDHYEPTRSKEGNADQYIGIAKSATGFTLKKGQASNVIRKKSHDTIHAQIGQFFFPPSVDACSENDPDGACKLESVRCTWENQSNKRQFRRCYVRMSIASHFWSKAGVKLWICDGTFTKLRGFKQMTLVACTFDGNNQIIILAFAIVDVENGIDWTWFKECLEDDFPGCEVWMSDADKGIESRGFTLSMSQNEDSTFERSRCIRHMSENCREKCKGKMNEDDKQLIVNLAKARTETDYEQKLKQIDAINEDWAQWLDERKEEFSTVSFLEKGI